MSAKERIEETSQVGELEMQWLRGNPGEFLEWAIERSKSSVGGHGLPHPEFRSRTHTHICVEGTPSLPDLAVILSDIKWSNIRNWHIVSLGETGNVEGYFSMRATERMVETLKNSPKEEKNLSEEIFAYSDFGHYLNDNDKVRIKAESLEKLKELGLSVRSLAMEGYIFNGKGFVKK